MSSAVYSDDIAIEAIKEPSRKRYLKLWSEFKDKASNSGDFDMRMPTEDELADYFRYLRIEKKMSSSTIWTTYSILNSVVKAKYGKQLQIYPRLTLLLKSYNTDTKKKAAVFETEDLDLFVNSKELSTPYWLVRKVCLN